MKKSDMCAFSIRIPEELKKQLEVIAEKEERSVNNVIGLALKEYVKNHADKLT